MTTFTFLFSLSILFQTAIGFQNPSSASSKRRTLVTLQEARTASTVDSIVCGGGPAGLLTAIMLSQKYPDQKVNLYDRLAAPPSPDDDTVWSDVAKFYLIGLGGRGQSAMKSFGVWEQVEKRCVAVVGRKDWQPGSTEGTERIFSSKEKQVTTQVLPRDKLVGVLHEYILEKCPNVSLNYGYELTPVDFEYNGGTQALVAIAKCTEEIARQNPSQVKTASEEQVDVLCSTEDAQLIATNFLVAADGTARTVPNAMEQADQDRIKKNPLSRLFNPPFRVKRYVNDNERVYKTIPMKIPSNWRPDLNYSARTKRINYDALPANGKGNYCGVLLFKRDDPLAKPDTDPAELRAFMEESLPQFSSIIDDETLEAVAKKPVSYLPGFRYAGPRLHQGNSCVILGDSIHTVKPYFGLGFNSAAQDVQVLGEVLDSTQNVAEAVKKFTKVRAGEAKTLVKISRDLDRPGFIGFITFILPLILDSIFSNAMPKLFRPNIISMLQRDNLTFRQVARRKRLDRLNQVLFLGSAVTLMAKATAFTVKVIASKLGKSQVTVVAAGVASLLLVKALQTFFSIFSINSTAGEVLSKMPGGKKENEDMGNAESFLTPLPFGNQKE